MKKNTILGGAKIFTHSLVLMWYSYHISSIKIFIWTRFQFFGALHKNILTNKKGGMADTSTREVVSCNTDLLLAPNIVTTELSPQQLHQLYLCSLLLGRKK